MINKLRNKIFWILQISLTFLVFGIILVYIVLNYKTTMESISNIIERYIDEIGASVDDRDEVKNEENVYTLFIENSEVTENPDNADEYIQELAIKVANKGSTTGIISDYIYKLNEREKNSYIITIAENPTIISHIKSLLISSGIIFLIAIIIIFFISKKISLIIVEPVEKMFEKQKQFISDASHELKTPISIIQVNAEVAEKKLGKNKWVDYILAESDSMNNLVNEMLLLTKEESIKNIKNKNQYEEINWSNEAKIIISIFEVIAHEKNIELEAKIEESIKIYIDKEDIKHIMYVLLDNAIKHTSSGNKIIVHLSKDQKEKVLQVKNQGEPIPDDEKDKIFERFYRVDKSRNRNEKRYGLGLAIAKAIVEKYNGKINVECKNRLDLFYCKTKLKCLNNFNHISIVYCYTINIFYKRWREYDV